jgi:predicted RNA binding protein YcfA (HicA-like mRNA interferase family)
MQKLKSVKRDELIRRLKKFGFDGPFAGGNHLFMIRSEIRLTLPNPHRQDIGVDLLSRILKQAGITREEWVKNR